MSGDAILEEVSGGVRIAVELDDARPSPGKLAVHIHEKGDCSDIPGKSMGDHFSPRDTKHGLPTDPEHHMGDLGNIEIDGDGDGELKIQTVGGNLRPADAMSFVGRALVVHEGTDKGTQPAGGAGKPIACAVIEPAAS
jgi:Cu-Zn family superoxide dismutase